jgi:hypothetical protein
MSPGHPGAPPLPLYPPGMQNPPAEEILPTAPPINVDVPYLSGASAVGSTLNCTMGNWQNEPTSYTYAWKSNGTDLTVTGDTYIVVASDAGHSITCIVTAVNAIGSTAAPPSNAIAISSTETPPTAPPVNVDIPYLGGAGTVGSTLTCTMGNWQNEPTGYTYQFKSDGTTDLTGTNNTYVVKPNDDTHSITCVVTATNSLGSTTAPPSNAVVASGIVGGLSHPLAAALAIALTPGLPDPPPATGTASSGTRGSKNK